MLAPVSGLPPHSPQLVGGCGDVLHEKLAREVPYGLTGAGQRAEEKRREKVGSAGGEKGMARKKHAACNFFQLEN